MVRKKEKLDCFLEDMQVEYYGEETNPAKKEIEKLLGDKEDLEKDEWDKLAEKHGDDVVGSAYVEIMKDRGKISEEGEGAVEESDGEGILDMDISDDDEDYEDGEGAVNDTESGEGAMDADDDVEPSIKVDGEEEEEDPKSKYLLDDEEKVAVELNEKHYDFLTKFLAKVITHPALNIKKEDKINKLVEFIVVELLPTNRAFNREGFETHFRKEIDANKGDMLCGLGESKKLGKK